MSSSPRLAALVDPAAHADGEADEVWRWLRTHQPVVRHEESAYPPYWSLTRYADIQDAYTSPDRFSSASGVLLRPAARGEDPGSGRTLALTDPPRHGRIRAVLAPRFSEGCARSFADVILGDVRAVLARAADEPEVDGAHDIAARLSSLLSARLIGVPDADLGQVCGWLEEVFAAAVPITNHTALVGYLIDLIYDRMEQPTADAISGLVDGSVEGEPLSETEILLNLENLIGASENGGLSIASGLAAFLQFPEQWAAVVDDPDLVPSAVEEVLRWASSATHSMRTAARDLTVHGQRIPAGERVVLWVRSANRDEAVFDRPECFTVRRQPNRHLAFGTGEHVCIGQIMARHQLRCLLRELIASRTELIATGPVVPLRSIAVNGPARLPLRLRPGWAGRAVPAG